ncbi:MAG: 3-oxoadipate enol-lactonase [Pseudomonadota bacterium]
MQFATINGVTLHYQVIGAQPDKPVVVFANSLGTDFRIWRDLVVRLAGDYAIVNYDKRGHGLSDTGDSPYEMADHINDLAALLDHLDVTNAVICGLSVGGMIAQGLALTRPDLVRALILCDTGHKIGNDDLWNERIAAVEEGGIEAISDDIMSRWFSEAFRVADNPDFEGYRNMLIRTPKAGYIGTSVAIRDTDYTDDVSNISVPTLCVVGDEDGSTPPELVKELASLISGANCDIIEGAGHLPCIEKPDQLYDLISPFLSFVSSDGGARG